MSGLSKTHVDLFVSSTADCAVQFSDNDIGLVKALAEWIGVLWSHVPLDEKDPDMVTRSRVGGVIHFYVSSLESLRELRPFATYRAISDVLPGADRVYMAWLVRILRTSLWDRFCAAKVFRVLYGSRMIMILYGSSLAMDRLKAMSVAALSIEDDVAGTLALTYTNQDSAGHVYVLAPRHNRRNTCAIL